MNEDVMNTEIRRFLKKVGITSQQELEKAIGEAVAAGSLNGDERLRVTMRLEAPHVGLSHQIDGEIALSD